MKICEIRVLKGQNLKLIEEIFKDKGFWLHEIGETGNTVLLEVLQDNQ